MKSLLDMGLKKLLMLETFLLLEAAGEAVEAAAAAGEAVAVGFSSCSCSAIRFLAGGDLWPFSRLPTLLASEPASEAVEAAMQPPFVTTFDSSIPVKQRAEEPEFFRFLSVLLALEAVEAADEAVEAAPLTLFTLPFRFALPTLLVFDVLGLKKSRILVV